MTFSPALEALLEEVKAIHPQEIQINYPKDEKVGYLRHDHGQHYVADGKVQIDVYDKTAPEYTISHELLHFMLMFDKTPQASVNVTTGDKDLDATLTAAGSDLYSAVLHARIYQEQRKRGFITEEIEQLYLEGVVQRFPKEEEADQWLVLRILTLLDALVFFQGGDEDIIQLFAQNNPVSFRYAQMLYQVMLEKELNTPSNVRRAIVRLWDGFDQILQDAGYAPMGLKEFMTLSPVLSQRQTRLQLSQLFEIYHSNLQDNLKFKDAYIGRFKNDGQNSFVLSLPAESSPEEMKRLYEQPVGQYLQELGFTYLIR